MSGIFYNNIEMTDVFCEGCRTLCPLVNNGRGGAELDTCGCVRINNRIILSTKGNILCKCYDMYNEEYEEEEEEDTDEEEEEEDEEEINAHDKAVLARFPSNQICRECEINPILRGESLCEECWSNEWDNSM